jgi:hypothetical protein
MCPVPRCKGMILHPAILKLRRYDVLLLTPEAGQMQRISCRRKGVLALLEAGVALCR